LKLLYNINNKQNEIIFILIQNELFNDEPLSRRKIAHESGISMQTVAKELKKLIDEGAPIFESKSGKTFVYSTDLDKLEEYLKSRISVL